MSLTVKKLEAPSPCRWEQFVEVEHNEVLFQVYFLFDIEGVEDHTIIYRINDEDVDEKNVPDEVTSFVEDFTYQGLFN